MRPQKILNISIIAPVLDEGDRIGPFLQHLRQRASPAELIVVTAAGVRGSSQSLIEICDRTLTAPRARASQMNAGAAVAGGDVFWFVHGDCEAPNGCLEEISRALADPRTVGGCFRIQFPRRNRRRGILSQASSPRPDTAAFVYNHHQRASVRRDRALSIDGFVSIARRPRTDFPRIFRSGTKICVSR